MFNTLFVSTFIDEQCITNKKYQLNMIKDQEQADFHIIV